MNEIIIGYIIALVLDVIVIAETLRQIIKLRVKTIYYFLGSFLLLAFADVANFISFLKYSDVFQIEFVSSIVPSIGANYALLLLIVFFKSFDTDQPFSGNIAIFSVIISLINGALAACISILNIFTNFVANIGDINSIFEGGSVSNEIGTLLILIGVLFLLNLAISLILIIYIIKSLLLRKNKAKNPIFKKTLSQMLNGFWFIVIGEVLQGFGGPNTASEAIFSTLIHFLGGFLSLSGFFLVFWIFLKRGIFILQQENLRMLIVMDNSGIPLYSYYFSQNISNNADNISTTGNSSENDEMIFSGALKAISTLLISLTGAHQQLREIELDNSSLLISSSADLQYNVVLLAEKTSKYYQEVLPELTGELFKNITSIEKNLQFNEKNKLIAEEIIQNYFGK